MQDIFRPLGAVSTIIMGTSPNGSTYNREGKGLPLLNGPTEFGPDHPDCSLFTTDPKRACEPGDLIFCVRGSTTGRMNWADKKYALGRGVCAIRGKTRNDTLFIRYALEANLTRLLQFAGGTTFPNLTKDALKSFLIPFPENRGQIVSILSAYDDLIENNRRRIKLLEQAARLLYKEWFVHLRFPGHEHVKIKNGLPEGWERKRLGDIAEIVMGQSPKSEHYNEDGIGLPFHQGVTNFGFRFPTHKTYCTITARIAEPGDILFSVRAPVGRINITLDKIVIGRGLSAIRSNCGQQSFLFYSLKNHFFKEDIMGGGVIFAAITKKDLHDVELLQPPYTLIEMFQEQVFPIDHQIANLYRMIEHLVKARDLLLPRLMNGEITV